LTREVASLRLNEEERAAIEAAARRERITPSEFLRSAALLVAHRLAEAAKRPKPKPKPVEVEPEPRRDSEPHVTTTYPSFEADRNRGGITAGPDTAAMPSHYLEKLGRPGARAPSLRTG